MGRLGQLPSDCGFECMKFGLVCHSLIVKKWLELDDCLDCFRMSVLELFTPKKMTTRYLIEIFQLIILPLTRSSGGSPFLSEMKNWTH